MFITNAQPRLIEFVGQRLVRDAAGKNVLEQVHVKLMPGVNDVDPARWDIVKNGPVAKALIASKALKIPEEPAAKAGSLKDLSAADAIQVVEQTVDPKLLERWFADETRKTVLEAIEKQLEKLDKAQPKA